MKLWWYCPKCNEKIDFQNQLEDCFEDDGEAMFSVQEEDCSLLHRISCSTCKVSWMVFISGLEEAEQEDTVAEISEDAEGFEEAIAEKEASVLYEEPLKDMLPELVQGELYCELAGTFADVSNKCGWLGREYDEIEPAELAEFEVDYKKWRELEDSLYNKIRVIMKEENAAGETNREYGKGLHSDIMPFMKRYGGYYKSNGWWILEEWDDCPVCGETLYRVDNFIENPFKKCGVCVWVHNKAQLNNPDLENLTNQKSLNQARQAYMANRKSAMAKQAVEAQPFKVIKPTEEI